MSLLQLFDAEWYRLQALLEHTLERRNQEARMRAAKREMVTRQVATVAENGGDRATIPPQSRGSSVTRLTEETADDITASAESAEVDGAAKAQPPTAGEDVADKAAARLS
ncbi:unnamed protein product [Linum trigynum]|uniref:Uncharacterized protein n=1 Tax=Linum trigynum TaxID=586398 RepID=A0AAV2E6X8_9ROSI